MIRRLAAVGGLTLLVVGCAHPGDAPAPRGASSAGRSATIVGPAVTSPLPDSAPPSTPKWTTPPITPSPFHDAVVSYVDSEWGDVPNGLTLCPMAGRTFVCGVTGVPLVSTDEGVVDDVATEAAFAAHPMRPEDAFGRFETALGCWPDQAWITGSNLGTPERFAVHYEDGRWQKRARWVSPTRGLAAPFGSGVLVTGVLTNPEVLSSPTYPLRLLLPHDAQRAVRTGALKGHVRPGDVAPAIDALGSGGGAVFVAAHHDGSLFVERWSGPAGATRRLDPVAHLEDAGAWAQAFWVRGASDAVLFGSLGGAPETPLFARFDGQAWSHPELPPGLDRVVAYDRTKRGRERVFGGSDGGFLLFERTVDASLAATSPWQSIALPPLRASESIEQVWLANDDAWLLVSPRQLGKSPPRLMRMQPVKTVWTYPTEAN